MFTITISIFNHSDSQFFHWLLTKLVSSNFSPLAPHKVGLEAGGRSIPAMISPWGVIGEANDISIATELVSCFETNPMAIRIDIHCNVTSCPQGGVGIYNPGYWGMDIHEGHSYKVVFYVKSSESLDVTLAFASEDGNQVLASRRIMVEAKKVENWTKMKITLKASQSYATARLQLTTSKNAIIWGHGFQTDLVEMISRLQLSFLKFPGGAYVEGYVLNNAFRWKATIGPWEKRPEHVSFWGYWTDDGHGFLEYLQEFLLEMKLIPPS